MLACEVAYQRCGEGRTEWVYEWGARSRPWGSVELGADGEAKDSAVDSEPELEDLGAGDQDAANQHKIVSIYHLDAKNKVQKNPCSNQERVMRRIYVD